MIGNSDFLTPPPFSEVEFLLTPPPPTFSSPHQSIYEGSLRGTDSNFLRGHVDLTTNYKNLTHLRLHQHGNDQNTALSAQP